MNQLNALCIRQPAKPSGLSRLVLATPFYRHLQGEIGAGIWVLELTRGNGHLAGDPVGNAVKEPYVQPYGPAEGILGLKFEGIEITQVAASGSVITGECNDDGTRNTVLTINFDPPLPQELNIKSHGLQVPA